MLQMGVYTLKKKKKEEDNEIQDIFISVLPVSDYQSFYFLDKHYLDNWHAELNCLLVYFKTVLL